MTEPRTTGGLDGRQILALTGDLNPSRVASRKGGGGRSLSYLEAWDVRARLNQVFGFAQWSADVLSERTEIVDKQVTTEGGKTRVWAIVLATVTMRLTIHATGATYTETAAADQMGPQGIGEVQDFAVKTAASDAFKRCAMNLGTQFGLSLYNDGSTTDVVEIVTDRQQMADLEQAKQMAITQIGGALEVEDLRAITKAFGLNRGTEAYKVMSKKYAELSNPSGPEGGA